MWMIGDVETVTADVKSVTGRYGDIDECGEAILQFKNGAIGTLAGSWVDVDNAVTLLISGTEGHAVIMKGQLYYKSNKVPGADGSKPWTDLPESQPHPTDVLIDAMGGKTGLPLISAREAADRVSVMQAMYEAAKQRAWVAPR
jgi:predicted dehydrogenase